MSDPYRDSFVQSYISSKDFSRMYGVGINVKLRLFGFDVREVKDPQNFQGPPLLKPIVYFVEHQRLPMFVNKTQHDQLWDRFGEGYWLNQNRDWILHAPILLRCKTKTTKSGTQYIVEYVDTPGLNISQWDPLDSVVVAKMRDAMDKYKINRDQFRSFVNFNYPELLSAFDRADGPDTLPRAFHQVFADMCNEIKSDLTHRSTPPQETRREPEPRGDHAQYDQYDQGMNDAPNFKTPAEQDPKPIKITHDDIPF